MSFGPNSRYAKVEVAEMVVPDANGQTRTVAYTRRRILPSYDDQPALATHPVSEGERLDNITARYTGDPTLFWILCDANNVLRPTELEAVGRVIRIAMARR
jgi:hypothetical protein